MESLAPPPPRLLGGLSTPSPRLALLAPYLCLILALLQPPFLVAMKIQRQHYSLLLLEMTEGVIVIMIGSQISQLLLTFDSPFLSIMLLVLLVPLVLQPSSFRLEPPSPSLLLITYSALILPASQALPSSYVAEILLGLASTIVPAPFTALDLAAAMTTPIRPLEAWLLPIQ